MTDQRPTLGVEIELGIFAPGQPVGQASTLPSRLVAHAQKHFATLPRRGRSGLFTCAGLMYSEMHRLLELGTWPAADLAAVLRQEDAALLMAKRVFEASGLGAGHRMVCYPDDVSGPPRLWRRRTDQTVSASIGTHVNLVVPGGVHRVADTAITLACCLSEIVGPGGFVRRGKGLEFWRDPRAAHVHGRISRTAHDTMRPVVKATGDDHRLQVISMGFARSRFDRMVKYGLLLLLGCHAASGRHTPVFELRHPHRLLHGTAKRRVPFAVDGQPRTGTRSEILHMLLDEVLEPAVRTELGRAAGCETAIVLARRLLELVADTDDVDGLAERVVAEVPVSWALKQHAFAKLLADADTELPLRRWRPPPEATGDTLRLLQRLSMLSILEACVLGDDVRRFLVDRLDGAWTYDQVYGCDGDAEHAVAEGRVPAGAIAAAAEITAALQRPDDARTDELVCADWQGVRRVPMPAVDPATGLPAGMLRDPAFRDRLMRDHDLRRELMAMAAAAVPADVRRAVPPVVPSAAPTEGGPSVAVGSAGSASDVASADADGPATESTRPAQSGPASLLQRLLRRRLP